MAITDKALLIIFENINVSAEWTLFIIALCGSLIFFATDFKLGLVLNFLVFSLLFLYMYHEGLNYVPFIVVALISLVIMSITLLLIQKTSTQGGALI